MFKSAVVGFIAWLGFHSQNEIPKPVVSSPEEEIVIVYIPPVEKYLY